MASVLQIEGLTKSTGDGRVLFEDVSLSLEEGEKVGLIARNGTGKTTLLQILAGRADYDSGRIVPRRDLRVAYLPQVPDLDPDMTALEGCRAFWQGVGEPDSDALTRMMHQLGIDDPQQPVSQLSGGQRKRIAIAAIVASEPELVILDEPTNHLDIPVIEWLEKWLAKARITLLMVTHDRYFLDRVCNRIIEMADRSLFSYDGNYDLFLRRRAERIAANEAELARVTNTLRREQEWMNRQPQARAGKAKYRIDAFHEMSERRRELSRRDDAEIDPSEMSGSYIGSKIFEARGVGKSYGDKVLLRDFDYVFARFDKVGIIGPNGAGKSTFIKMLQGLVKPDSGHFDVGSTVRFGYYSQEGISFKEGMRVIDAVTAIAEEIRLTSGGGITPERTASLTPMQWLNRFLFSPKDQQKYIHTLSGGERCRLHLATVLMRNPNFLILDEPTNDLDIVTLGILEDYLRSFKGCAIVVSHDRYFLDTVAQHLFVMEGDGTVRDFPGTYTEYRAKREQERAAQTAAVAAPKTESRKPRPDRPRKLTWAEKRELETLTTRIDELTAEKVSLEAIFASGADAETIAKASSRYEALKTELDEAELRWLELDELS